jgi:excisionase family DNA binding protein
LAEKLTAWGQPAAPALIERALRDLLDGQDQSTKQLRTAIQIHLAIMSNAGTSVDNEGEEMLSTEAAAKLMGCSRPYVAMLIDAGKLTGGVKSNGGHRKVPKSSVLQWIKATRAGDLGDSDYRKAAADLDMYATPETEYVKAAKRGR